MIGIVGAALKKRGVIAGQPGDGFVARLSARVGNLGAEFIFAVTQPSSDDAVSLEDLERPIPHAPAAALEAASELEHGLVEERPAAVGALLIGTFLLRVASVGASLAIGFELVDMGTLDSRVIGIVSSVNLVAELIFAAPLARLADRFGRTRFLMGGPLIGALGLILLTLARQPLTMGASRLLEGIAAAAFVPTALGTIAAATAHSSVVRARASSLFEASTLAGYAMGGLLAGIIHHFAHHNAFLVFACVYIAAAAVCSAVPRVPGLPISPLGPLLKAIAGPGPIRTFLPAWLASFALIGAFLANIPPLLKNCIHHVCQAPGSQSLLHRFDERLVSGVTTFGLLALVIGIALWTPVLPRLGAVVTMRRATPGAWILCAALLALNHNRLQFAPLFLPIVITGIIVLAGFGPAAVVYLAECSETFIADRSALMAFYTITLAAGGLVGGIAGGFAAQWLKIDGVVLVVLVLSLLAYVALGRVQRYERALVRSFAGDEVPGGGP